MSLHFELEQRFTAPVEAVEAAFSDPSLLAGAAELPGLGRAELLDIVEEGGTVRRRVRFAFTGPLSKAALALLDPDRLTWVEDSILDRRTHRSEFRILPDHYAARLSCAGTVTLDQSEGVTRRVTVGDLQVRVPFVGGRVERAIVSGLHEHAAAEEAFVQQWLDRA